MSLPASNSNRFLKLAAFLLLFAALPAAAHAQGSLEGTVRDAATNQGVVGAQVFISALNIGSLTDNDGSFSIGGVPVGSHIVEIQLIGYAAERQEVTIADGQATQLDVILSEEAIALGGIVAIGTRARPRTVTESAVPIDVIPNAEIVNQGDNDFANLLRNVVPSFNVNIQPISDAATFARPANLRGLAPDHTLILLNGKRRHRTAVITWYGNGLADGSQGPDLAMIPGLALEQAEVLRDGAAAQYGSDAIAGVMNFILKNDRSGGAIEIKTGGNMMSRTGARFEDGTIPGDGEMYSIAGNFGLPLGENGFLNLTGEYGNANPTDRSTQRRDAVGLVVHEGNTSVRTPAQIWGSPQVSDELKIWANTGYLFSDRLSFYGHGNYVSKQVEGGFYFRNPGTRSGVFATSGCPRYFGDQPCDPEWERSILLVGDLLEAQGGMMGAAGCPRVLVDPASGTIRDREAFNQVMADPNCFTFRKIFPGGFTPQFGAYVLDGSAVAGLRGTSGRLDWDGSVAWGKSNMDFYMYNTVNASLGPDQPCSTEGASVAVPDQPCTPYFRPGIYDQQEVNLNFDVSYAVNERVNLAGGAEWRNERFEIVPGDQASWTEGPLASQGFTPGSNGFTGFGPLTEGVWNRSNVATYGDLEIRDPEGAWTFGVAGRYENFSDFGSTLNGKISARTTVSEGFALRASASTGFRAPTPGQSNAFNISTIYDPVIMDLTNNGTIPSTSDLAVEYGGEPLVPETSVNLAVGAVVESGNFNMSFDAYQISMSDRLTFTQDFSLSPMDIDRLLAEGIIRPGGVLARFRFFINDFSTRSQGIDWVAAYRVAGGDGSGTTFSTAWNVNRTTVTEFNPQTLSGGRIRILEEGLPNLRANVSVNHDFASGMRLLVRASHWGGYYDGEQPYYVSDPGNTIDYPSRVLFDVEAAYSLSDNWMLTLGSQNVLNTKPQEYPGAADGVGNRFGQFTPYGFNGAFVYSKLGYTW